MPAKLEVSFLTPDFQTGGHQLRGRATNSLLPPAVARKLKRRAHVLLFADGGVAFDNAFIELVVAFCGRSAGFGFAPFKPPLNLSLTFYTRVGFLCGLCGASGIRRGEQEREHTENYGEG